MRLGECSELQDRALLARMEGRLAVMLAARDDELSEGQRRIEWMVDRLALMYLIHTPEVPEELRAGALATAKRRYTNYRKVVGDLLAKKDLEGAANQRPAGAAQAS